MKGWHCAPCPQKTHSGAHTTTIYNSNHKTRKTHVHLYLIGTLAPRHGFFASCGFCYKLWWYGRRNQILGGIELVSSSSHLLRVKKWLQEKLNPSVPHANTRPIWDVQDWNRGFDHINRNAPVLIRTPKLTRFEPA